MEKARNNTTAVICTIFCTLALIFFSLTSVEATSSGQAGSGAEVKKEVGEAATAIGEYSAEQKDAAMAKAKNMMDELQGKIDSFKTGAKEKMAAAQEGAAEGRDKTLKALQEKKDNLARWYEKMEQSTPEAWDEVKKGFSEAYTDLSDSFGKAAQEMK